MANAATEVGEISIATKRRRNFVFPGTLRNLVRMNLGVILGGMPRVKLLVMCQAEGKKGFGGFGGGEDKKQQAKKQAKPQVGAKRGEKRAVAVKEGSKQLNNVLRSVDRVSLLLSEFGGFGFQEFAVQEGLLMNVVGVSNVLL